VERTNSGRDTEAPALMPPVDVIEDPGGITLYADVPGVPKEKLNVRVDGENLVIEGLPRYRRVFTLSKELDAAASRRNCATVCSRCRFRKPSTRSRSASRRRWRKLGGRAHEREPFVGARDARPTR
jgi:hypothetical protein